MDKLKIGIVACSNVAKKRFIPALKKSRISELYYIGSRNKNKSRKIANLFNCKKFGNYNDVIQDEKTDVVYISTPITERDDIFLRAIENKNIFFVKNQLFIIIINIKK